MCFYKKNCTLFIIWYWSTAICLVMKNNLYSLVQRGLFSVDIESSTSDSRVLLHSDLFSQVRTLHVLASHRQDSVHTWIPVLMIASWSNCHLSAVMIMDGWIGEKVNGSSVGLWYIITAFVLVSEEEHEIPQDSQSPIFKPGTSYLHDVIQSTQITSTCIHSPCRLSRVTLNKTRVFEFAPG
jgi:hypothetical protein